MTPLPLRIEEVRLTEADRLLLRWSLGVVAMPPLDFANRRLDLVAMKKLDDWAARRIARGLSLVALARWRALAYAKSKAIKPGVGGHGGLAYCDMAKALGRLLEPPRIPTRKAS
jgi:hypothetical protein